MVPEKRIIASSKHIFLTRYTIRVRFSPSEKFERII